MQPFWVYMLRCSDGSYYTGHTDDLERRFAEHQDGSSGGYTSTRRPVELVWLQEMPSRDDAFLAEMQIKGWSRAKKEAMARADWERVRELAAPRSGPDLRRGPLHISEMFPFAMGLRKEQAEGPPVVPLTLRQAQGKGHHVRTRGDELAGQAPPVVRQAHHERTSDVERNASIGSPLTLSLSKGERSGSGDA